MFRQGNSRLDLVWRSVAGLVVVIAVATPLSPAIADDLSAETIEEARFLLRSMLDARQQVRSGEVEISGGLMIADGSRTLIEGDVMGLYLFDAAAGMFRYESSEPCNITVTKPGDRSTPPKGSVNQFQVPFKSCRTGDYYASWTRSSEHSFRNIHLFPPEADTRDSSTICGKRPLDVLAAGMLGYFEFNKGYRATEVYTDFLSKDITAVATEGDRVTLEMSDHVVRCTLVIDKELLAPVSLVQESLTDPSVFVNDAEWEAVEGVVVPIRFRTEFVYPDIENQIYDLDFKWSRINGEFDPAEFEYTEFTGIPGGYIDVFDRRGPGIRHLGVWEADGVVANPIPLDPVGPTSFGKSESGASNWRMGLVIGNIVVLLVLLSIWWYRRSRRANVS